jgi:ubiquinone/menaquinone biosynthesis C-methylase UbiE
MLGIDQSLGMLPNAIAKFPAVQFQKVGLQEITLREEFDGAICMDAMENVSPEDWPQVLGNFHRALKQSGWLYFTAETLEKTNHQVREWTQQAGFEILKEAEAGFARQTPPFSSSSRLLPEGHDSIPKVKIKNRL